MIHRRGDDETCHTLPGSKTAIGAATSDAAEPKADEATRVTMVASASNHPTTLASRPDSGKLTEDGPDGVEDRKPWPPLPVAQGHFKLGLLNANEAERFQVTLPSFMVHAA